MSEVPRQVAGWRDRDPLRVVECGTKDLDGVFASIVGLDVRPIFGHISLKLCRGLTAIISIQRVD